MTLLLISFLAGVLTVLAPCVLPLLPVVIGGSIARGGEGKNSWYRPLVIAASLTVSLVLFSLLIQASTALLGVPQMVWQVLSGALILALGINFLKPKIWTNIALKTGLYSGSNKFFSTSYKQQGTAGDVLIGVSLGPIFSSCSPTYAFILAAILPKSFVEGLAYLIAYAIGLAGMLLLVAYGGQSLVARLGWLVNPHGWFHKAIGMVFLLVGTSIIFGFDKDIQAYILNQGWYDPIGKFEENLRT